MGDYRDIVEDLIHYCNKYAAVYKKERALPSGNTFTYSQIQVLEYLLENEERNQNMSSIARRLGITMSSFSKMASLLEKRGLIEKYNLEGNKKNIVMRVTEQGRTLYAEYAEYIHSTHFNKMFAELDSIPREYLPLIAKALSAPYPSKKATAAPAALVPCKKRGK